MKALTADRALAETGDREAIRDCLHRYCRAIDRRDAEMLTGVYWPGAMDHHGVLDAPVEQFVPEVMASLAAMDQTMHMLGNVLMRIEGDTAAVESQFHAYHRIPGEGGPGEGGAVEDVHLGGRYLDRMEKRGGEWRIAERTVAYDWYATGGSAPWPAGAFGLSFASNIAPSDPSCALFAGVERGAG